MLKSIKRALARLALIVGPILGLAPTAAYAICDVDYVVQGGDNLFSIAEAHYGSRERWSLIYYRNQSELVGSSVIPGRKLYIPCPPEDNTPDATPLQKADAELTLLTGNNVGPFTNQSLPGQGMVTELVNAALELSPSPVSYAMNWDDTWSGHLAKLGKQEFDMGFPWAKPDCAANPGNERCSSFHFSDPLVSIPVMLFVPENQQFTFANDSDIEGKTLCRPSDQFVDDLEQAGRRWLSDGKVDLIQPETAVQCFELLQEGKVDAVSVDLFLGASTIVDMNLRDKVVPLERPIGESSLHVVISKRHWRGTSHLYRVNAGLQALRDSGRFEEIMSRHLELFWAQLQ